GVCGRERLPVGPLRTLDEVERPGLAAVRRLPRAREGRREVVVRVVLDEDRIDVLEGGISVLVESDVRVDRVDPRARPHPERSAGLARAARRAAASGQHERAGDGREYAQPAVLHLTLLSRVEESLLERERTPVGVERIPNAERDRGQVLAVPQWKPVEHGHAERLELLLEHVLEGLRAGPIGRGSEVAPVAVLHLADDDSGEALE